MSIVEERIAIVCCAVLCCVFKHWHRHCHGLSLRIYVCYMESHEQILMSYLCQVALHALNHVSVWDEEGDVWDAPIKAQCRRTSTGHAGSSCNGEMQALANYPKKARFPLFVLRHPRVAFLFPSHPHSRHGRHPEFSLSMGCPGGRHCLGCTIIHVRC